MPRRPSNTACPLNPLDRSDRSDRLDALIRDLGPQLRRGGIPVEPPPRCPTGIRELDRLLSGGFPRGRLSEMAGPASCGRTSLALHLLAQTTRVGEMTAVVDAADAFDPTSAKAAGARLERVLWVRPPRPREALRSTARLLEAHGFALILLDLQARRARSGHSDSQRVSRPTSLPSLPHPSSVWLRLARAAASTGTALVVLSTLRTLGASAELALQLKPTHAHFTGTPTLLEGLDIEVALVRHPNAPTDRSAHLRLTIPGG